MNASPTARLLAMARPQRRGLALAVLCGALTVACGIALFGVSGFLIARASEHPNEVALAVAVVAVRALGLGRGTFRYLERLSSHDVAFRVVADLRVAVYRRLERIVPGGLGVPSGADLLSRVVSDVDAVQDVFIRGVTPPLVAAVVGAATVAAAAALFRPAAALIAAGLLLAGAAVPTLATALAARADALTAAARGRLAASTGELLAGAPELLVYAGADRALRQVEADDAALRRLARRSATVSAIGTGLTALVTGATVWALLLLAVRATGSGSLGRVPLAAVLLTGLAAFEATAPLAAAAQQLAGTRASARRVFEVLDVPDPVLPPAQPLPAPTGTPHIVVRSARLRYGEQGPWALDGIDLDLAPGRRVAVVGRSGSGKSSLAGALVRFRDLNSGEITLAGAPLGRFDEDDVRRVITGCLADPHLFDSTLRENLRLARPAATQAELDEVGERVRLAEWIAGLPLGWETRVGAHGAAISGGQRQRLALARALLADPPVLVLDEPTAHLDAENTDALMADILRVSAGRSLLLITHDLDRLEEFDEVLVLAAGQVVQRGTAQSLRRSEGPFSLLSASSSH